MNNSQYIPARKSQLNFYKDVSLYHKASEDNYVLYKKSGMALHDIRIGQGKHPDQLYIKQSEKLLGIQEAQKGFNRQLHDYVKSGDHNKIKETLITVIEETLTEPRSGSLEGISDTMDILVSDYAKESDVIKNLLNISYTDYSTILHSINVMAFALGYSTFMDFTESEAKVFGLCALLHDVGKTKINQEILASPGRLTDMQFNDIKKHTTLGYNILIDCRFTTNQVAITALDHHEKQDGSGYPNGKSRISEISQLISLMDSYEALTNDDRPYRSSLTPFNALNRLGEETKAGKFDKQLYSKFVKSLAI